MTTVNCEKVMKALIIGGSSEIAKALCKQLVQKAYEKVVVVSQKNLAPDSAYQQSTVTLLQCHYQANDIALATAYLAEQGDVFDNIFVLNGILHQDELHPEKQLSDFNANNFETVIAANTITPMYWLSNISKLLVKDKKQQVVFFSARVGSITDNRLGGWYSYRASKAALNMMVKTAAIELKRRYKKADFLLFHPGTTDTPLSKPFQKNVAEDKLFTTTFVAEQLLEILANLPACADAHYLDWQGKEISW